MLECLSVLVGLRKHYVVSFHWGGDMPSYENDATIPEQHCEVSHYHCCTSSTIAQACHHPFKSLANCPVTLKLWSLRYLSKRHLNETEQLSTTIPFETSVAIEFLNSTFQSFNGTRICVSNRCGYFFLQWFITCCLEIFSSFSIVLILISMTFIRLLVGL